MLSHWHINLGLWANRNILWQAQNIHIIESVVKTCSHINQLYLYILKIGITFGVVVRQLEQHEQNNRWIITVTVRGEKYSYTIGRHIAQNRR